MTGHTSATISVVIPTYNGIRYIPDCLDSLRKQVRQPDEIILVDDGSTDGTESLVASSYPEVQIVRLDSNHGFAAAVNEGLRRCRGTYIALLNNDTRADARWIAELAGVLDENPSAGFCSSKMLFADRPTVINSIGIGFTRAGAAFDVGEGQADGDKFNRPRPIFGACAGAAMYRKKLFDEVGLMDEDLFMWYEDVDLSFRARMAGYECLYVPTAVIYHVRGGTAPSSNKLHVYYCVRNQILVLAKNLPDGLRRRYLTRLILASTKHSLKQLLTGDVTVARGCMAALMRLKYFLNKRHQIQCLSNSYIDDIERSMTLDTNDYRPVDGIFQGT